MKHFKHFIPFLLLAILAALVPAQDTRGCGKLAVNPTTGKLDCIGPVTSGMVYPGAGVAKSTGSAWDTSYTVGVGASNLVQLNGSSQLPAVDASLLVTLPTPSRTKSCELHLFPVTSETISCYNDFGVTTTITAVRCYADAGSPTIRPKITGGTSTSILSGDLTCGTASWANGTLNGTPTRSSAGTIDANVVSASTANWIRVIITETLP